NETLVRLGTAPIKNPVTLEEILRRPEVSYKTLSDLGYPPQEEIPPGVIEQVEIQVKYAGYINRQEEHVEKFKKMEKIKMPSDFDYRKIPGLSREVQEKLTAIRPVSLGQASRISGITPAALSILMVYLKRLGTV
ncbi:MAG TPA: tRNA uridine-5-carboxymethylaminomethyl(34) synthesis enzyme MnmG, partial [Thermodesulfobacteriota bacterium]|nr:tRNA uridine-5-carboxymethylaminomethyl(34) synthesis enzyme MnmG [Thermodesulfobacteriota bacterium]